MQEKIVTRRNKEKKKYVEKSLEQSFAAYLSYKPFFRLNRVLMCKMEIESM